MWFGSKDAEKEWLGEVVCIELCSTFRIRFENPGATRAIKTKMGRTKVRKKRTLRKRELRGLPILLL